MYQKFKCDQMKNQTQSQTRDGEEKRQTETEINRGRNTQIKHRDTVRQKDTERNRHTEIKEQRHSKRH